MNLEQLWRNLDSTASRQPGLTRLAAGGPREGRVYAALEEPGAGLLLLLRVPQVTMQDVSGHDGEGLDLRWLRLEDDTTHCYLALSPRPDADRVLFMRLAQDVAEQLVRTDGGEAAVHVLLGRLRDWRAFLRVRGGGLGHLALRGLFGELWFIRERLLPRMAITPALSAWTGPGGAAQDFRLGNLRLDVKTTASAESGLEISSAEQLDVPPGQRLLLAHLVLDSAAEGESVPRIVASLRAAAAAGPQATSLLEGRLLQLGYHHADEALYAEPRLHVTQSHLYEVGEGFPRLTPDFLPRGVTNVRYTIDPGLCWPFLRDPAEALVGFGASSS